MMQGLHHQQQQLAALLNAALLKDDSASSTPAASAASATASQNAKASNSDGDESSRLAAINSLHRAILFPPNSVLVSHSASYLSQGFLQLLNDKSYAVRQASATAYGALCAVLCSILIGPNGRQNHVMLGNLVDRFIGWALPLLNNVSAGDGTTELAVEGLREFLSVGDVMGIERYVLPILKACQQLMEDERTSMSLLHCLVGVLSLISVKFFRVFQPHFLDIVDVLLGWVLVPDLAESDRRIILDSFLQFQKHWVGNLQFSLGLLSKFLGDMDVLLQDVSYGTPRQFRRLLALLSCFLIVLQSTASGLLEMNLLDKISESLSQMLPQLLRCISLVGKKFGWSQWIGDSWKCLTLLAEILGERFSTFYPLAVDILFQSLETNSMTQTGGDKISSFQVHGVLKTNLQLLSLQKLGLLPSSVKKVLQFDAPVSHLRLHHNHLVAGSSAATYVFFLQHGNDEVVKWAMTVLKEELELLKDMLKKTLDLGNEVGSVTGSTSYSKSELLALMKFDLKVLLTCVSSNVLNNLIKQPDILAIYLKRSEDLACFINEKLDPFLLPVKGYLELQVSVIKAIDRLTTVEFVSKCSLAKLNSEKASRDNSVEKTRSNTSQAEYSIVTSKHLRKYSVVLIQALHVSSPLAIKVVALEWIQNLSLTLISIYENLNENPIFCEGFGYIGEMGNVILSVLDVAFDREPKVRSHVASVLEDLLRARLIEPMFFYPIAQVVLEKLGDPDIEIKDAFVKLLSYIIPTMVYMTDLHACGTFIKCFPSTLVLGNSSNLHWKQLIALKQLRQQLHSQQLVLILSYISQRWKLPLSSWIERLIHSRQSSKDHVVLGQLEETGKFGANVLSLDIKVDEGLLERICSVNNLAGACWAIHEAARYCIITRLRTNLGGPTQTFAALERMLLDISHVLQLDIAQNDGNLSIIGSSGAHLLPMRLLLDFVEALKKNVYNAYEGSAILPSATRQSSLFFRANRKVCEEWFSRICEPMMNAGLALQCHDATIQYCGLRLLELKNLMASSLKDKSRPQVSEIRTIREKFSGDILRVLQHMSLALCKSQESEALAGLQQWAAMTFGFLLVDENQSPNQSGMSGHFAWITGLVYQAEGQYERAAAFFTHLLQDEESLCSMGSDGIQFAISRIIESYTALSDWTALESWLSELQMLRSKHAGRSYSGALTTAGNEINAIHALACFDEGDLPGAWAYLDLTPKSSSELTLDPKLALQRSEQMLLQAMLLHCEGKVDKVPNEIHKAKEMLEEILSVSPLDCLTETWQLAGQLHCIYVFEECHKRKGDLVKPNPHLTILSSYVESVHSIMNRSHQDCSSWLKILRVYQTYRLTSPITLKLCMGLSSLARKQGNLMLASRLNTYLHGHVQSCSDKRYSDFLTSNLQYEDILLMYSENKFEDAFANLWSFIRPCMVTSGSVSDSDDNIMKAKACLKLAGWLRRDYPELNMESIIYTMRSDLVVNDVCLLGSSESSDSVENSLSKPSLSLVIEEIVGTTIKSSTQLCSKMGKSWMSYASWCFSQARDSLSSPRETVLQSCSFSPVLLPEVIPERFKLTEDERTRVYLVLLQLFQGDGDSFLGEGEDWKISHGMQHLRINYNVESLVQQIVDMMEAAAGAPGSENSSGDSLSVTLASQLHTFLRRNASREETNISSAVENLVNVWWCLRRRRVHLFGCAALGFMQYLTCSSTKISYSQVAGSGSELQKLKSSDYILRASLYVLHILLNYGVELKETIESNLFKIPLLPWQEITPQLFARLSSHPEQVVRKELEGLLMMLAKQSPWSIVFPTLVDINANEKPSEELLHILGCLRDLYPRLVQDVQLMINELGNVTVLWEELWLGTLQDLHADVMRRISVLKEEATRIAENATLSLSEKNKINAAKYSAVMAPIVVALERRLASTSCKPETPHEVWFCEEYRERLKSAILTFKTPPRSPASLGDVWRPFDEIAASLASYQRKSSISLGEVAPQLALLSSSDVPMPGLEKQVTVPESEKDLTATLQGIITIASFSEQVTILSTKTKPKKLVIHGSDGKRYTYLLKGREDLRLDARIMQLLQAINGLTHSSSANHKHLLAIRYYSVTPISGQAGLIQWVENVTSIYSVFKSWQNRMQQVQLSAAGTGNTNNSVPPMIPRPSDMFYGKIIPALKEKGIRRVISRRDWPHDVKRKVLLELMKEVPRQLLHQELWCASEGFKEFSSKLKRYSGSVAAMSMVGHVLGLGDRHLDNILVDFSSGDIVHIDYNICFDKGQRLKVPEIVPFRLTQMIEAALGLTGVEGIFRASCEAIMGILRENKDILLMLLEVFLWDPLLEWTRGDFHDEAAIGGEERKGMELAVSLSLFASRVQEIRVPLQEHHDLLLATLPAVEAALERFADILGQYELASAVYFRADQERSNLILHETSAKSIVAEATSNSEKTRATFETQAREFAQAKALVVEKAREASTWTEQHGKILDALRSNLLPEINTYLKLSGMADTLSLTAAVQAAGVPLTIVPEPTQAQCQDIDREVSQLIAELDHGLSSSITKVHMYSLALQRILPLNYLSTSSVHGWAQVLQLSANAMSSDVLSIARRQAAELIAKLHGDNLDSVRQSHDDLCNRVEKYAIDIENAEAESFELENSIRSETESTAKDRLMSTFVRYMQSAGLLKKGYSRHDADRDSILLRGQEDKEKVLSVLNVAVSSLYGEVKHRTVDIFNNSDGGRNFNDKFGTVFSEFEEQVEKCVLVAEFVTELQKRISWDIAGADTKEEHAENNSEKNWASIFKSSLLSCKSLIEQMTEMVLHNVLRSAVSMKSEVMDTFGLISQIRGSVDMALEQLLEVELEKASLVELEKNYFVKVGCITEQQLVLEEAALKGRDHLSWEEAEELASQEEACRAQLDQLNRTWNEREMRNSSLIKKEADIRNALVSSELCLESLVNAKEVGGPHVLGSKGLLAMLEKPFSALESVDKELSTFSGSVPYPVNGLSNLTDLLSTGFSVSEHIWNIGGLLNSQYFFIWKVCIVDSFLDSCIHDVASSVDQNLGFDQLFNVVKKKLEAQLREHIGRYLKERVASTFLAWLDAENDRLKQMVEATKGLSTEQLKKDAIAVKKVQIMLEEYCNGHETARAVRSAASMMKRQVNELKEALHKTSLDIVQFEWMHDALTPSQKSREIFQKILGSGDKLYPIILNLSRTKLLEGMQSAMAQMVRSMEGLQACERNSVVAEGQLERAMGWACGGPNSSVAGNLFNKPSGIPPEFYDHLARRRKFLQEAQEKASDIVKICMSILEFEASRDGIFQIPGEIHPMRTGADGRAWQQNYLNALTKLEITYHSFTRTEQEWKLAQSSMETASNGFYSATNELRIASLKAKSASGDLQRTVLAMRDCASDLSVALSAFARVSRGQTALTSESGTMLDEVLAITEDLHDVHTLGKEAAAVHRSLMEGLSKANAILLPLESVLSKDVTAMTDAITRERETKTEVSPIHGQAIYQSYCLRIREAIQTFKPVLPSLTISVKGLYSILIRLARTANLHAGNLHKALEGLAESQDVKSQEISLSRPELDNGGDELDMKERESRSVSESGSNEEFFDDTGFPLQDKGYISPPDSVYSHSSDETQPFSHGSDGVDVTDGIDSGHSQNHHHEIPVSGQSVVEIGGIDGGDHISGAAGSVLNENEKSTVSPSGETVTSHNEPIQSQNEENSKLKSEDKDDDLSISSKAKIEDEALQPNILPGNRVTRGKNPYAMSVLRRIEMKIDGRDVSERRAISVAEQVDYLIKQATSVDNLCNMYEGWTPWI